MLSEPLYGANVQVALYGSRAQPSPLLMLLPFADPRRSSLLRVWRRRLLLCEDAQTPGGKGARAEAPAGQPVLAQTQGETC